MADEGAMTAVVFDRAYALMAGVLSDVRSELQFAETKNGALFATTMAMVVGIGAILAGSEGVAVSVIVWLGSVCFGLAGAAMVALSSFLPIMDAERHQYSRGVDGGGQNLIFWGEVNKFTPTGYAEAILISMNIAAQPGRLLTDLAEQIVINSGIAARKFRRFQIAAVVTGFSTVLPAVVFGAYLVGNGLSV